MTQKPETQLISQDVRSKARAVLLLGGERHVIALALREMFKTTKAAIPLIPPPPRRRTPDRQVTRGTGRRVQGPQIRDGVTGGRR
jgi:hypothetical protein